MSTSKPRRRARPISFRLTLAGWLFVGVGGLLGLAAFKSQAAFMFVLFGVMGGTMLFSAFTSRQMVSSLRLRRLVPSRAWQNQTIHLGYRLRNTRRRLPCLGIHVEELAPAGIDSIAGYCVFLPPKRIFRAGARFAVRRRGQIQLGMIKISTSFPFGLIEASMRVDRPASLLIWPARGVLKKQLLRHGAVETSSAAPSPATGGQDEFFGLREYRPGDNPRWIHWRRSATKRVPVVREMSKPLPEILWVLLDTYWEDLSEMGYRVRERTMRFASTLIDYAFAKGYRVGMALAYANDVAVHHAEAGLGQRLTLLDALARVDANTSLRIEDTIASLRSSLLKHAQVVLITSDKNRLRYVNLIPLQAACPHLAIIYENDLSLLFDDDPLARQEDA